MKKYPRLYFHTNIPAPYRKHQFELIAKVFSGSVFYFQNRKMDSDRPWRHDSMGWKADIRFPSQWELVKDLLFQPWGSVHIIGSGVPDRYFRLLELSALLGHSKLISWNDAGFPDSLPKYNELNIKRRFDHWLWLRCFTAVYAAGELGRKFSLAQGFAENQVINTYFSHDVDAFAKYRELHRKEDRANIRTRLHIDKDKIVMLNISRYLECKRLVDFADALCLLERSRPDIASKCELILIGDGNCMDHLPLLKKLKIVKVHLIKSMPPDEVLSYYCASDLFVFPSEGDIWGLVVNEALSMGLPVICTDRIGAAEIVRDGENGYKIPVRRPDCIAARIMEFVEDENKRKRFADAAVTIVDSWRTDMGVDALKSFLDQEG